MSEEKFKNAVKTSPLTEEEWQELERFWTKEYDALWNISSSG